MIINPIIVFISSVIVFILVVCSVIAICFGPSSENLTHELKMQEQQSEWNKHLLHMEKLRINTKNDISRKR